MKQCSDSQGFCNQRVGEDSQIRNSSPQNLSSPHKFKSKTQCKKKTSNQIKTQQNSFESDESRTSIKRNLIEILFEEIVHQVSIYRATPKLGFMRIELGGGCRGLKFSERWRWKLDILQKLQMYMGYFVFGPNTLESTYYKQQFTWQLHPFIHTPHILNESTIMP